MIYPLVIKGGWLKISQVDDFRTKLKPPCCAGISHDFPMGFPWFSHISQHFSMVFPWFCHVLYFPIFSKCFSRVKTRGFPMGSSIFLTNLQRCCTQVAGSLWAAGQEWSKRRGVLDGASSSGKAREVTWPIPIWWKIDKYRSIYKLNKYCKYIIM